MYNSLYQIRLKYTVYEITGQTALERYGLGKHFFLKQTLFYNFCCKMETVDFFYEKSAKYAKMSLKLPIQN